MTAWPPLALGTQAERSSCLERACRRVGLWPPGGAPSCLSLSRGPGIQGSTSGCSVQQCAEAAALSPQSLTGHTSPVESVRLNTPEELIVAGSQSGSIRVWDLEAAKSSAVMPLPPGNLPGLGWLLCSWSINRAVWKPLHPHGIDMHYCLGQLRACQKMSA
ncbi:hypothetical protein P7K49_036440 [Saguinus oedipus]|uniref:Uncharacterized protein n=1 Tax=Saguinus oedipus TaxID=9490 RepID=A0ABQ9TKP4_SAGOE|nr:hypothetical protein P7K49_036440 [Saguinus oedipus]